MKGKELAHISGWGSYPTPASLISRRPNAEKSQSSMVGDVGSDSIESIAAANEPCRVQRTNRMCFSVVNSLQTRHLASKDPLHSCSVQPESSLCDQPMASRTCVVELQELQVLRAAKKRRQEPSDIERQRCVPGEIQTAETGKERAVPPHQPLQERHRRRDVRSLRVLHCQRATTKEVTKP